MDLPLQLDDLGYEYPDIDDPQIQKKITSRNEFFEAGALPVENVPTRGKFYNPQTLIHRLMIPYDQLLLIHRTGTGKTGSSSGSAEKFRRSFLSSLGHYIENYIYPRRTYIKRAYVIVVNKPQIDDVARQIACKISEPGQFEHPDLSDPQVTNQDMRNKIRSLLRKNYYDIITVGQFIRQITDMIIIDKGTEEGQRYVQNAKAYRERGVYILETSSKGKKATPSLATPSRPTPSRPTPSRPVPSRKGRSKVPPRSEMGKTIKVYTLKPVEHLIKKYSHCIYILDEVHNLRPGDFRESPSMSDDKIKKFSKKNQVYYPIIQRFFHTIKQHKLMALSATPMINDPHEIVNIMNLILPKNNQMPNNIDFKTATLDQLEPYFRGRISYVREMTSEVYPMYFGSPLQVQHSIPWLPEPKPSQFTIDRSVMSEHQVRAYLDFLERNTKKKAFRVSELHISNFVYQDGSYGGGNPGRDGAPATAFHKYVQKGSGGRYKASPELKKYLADDGNKQALLYKYNNGYDSDIPNDPKYQSNGRLKELGTKMADIVRDSIEAKGNVYIFSRYVEGSGAVELSLSLEEQGFEPFLERDSIFVSELGSENQASFCQSGRPDQTGSGRKVRIRPYPRYAILTSSSRAIFENILDTYNSWENRHGDYIKVLIVTPIGREGLNTANVVSIHIMTSNWNESNTYQEISRAIRSGGHQHILDEKRSDYISQGLNPDDARIEVDIHLHASVFPDEPRYRNITPAEIDMYTYNEYNDILIKRVLRMMKQVAVDCQIHSKRNIKPITMEKDGSSVCDYQECNYPCYDSPPTELDYSSYDVLYSEPIRKRIQGIIMNIFSNVFYLKYDQLKEYIITGSAPGIDRIPVKFIEETLNHLIMDQVPLLNRYGYSSYLQQFEDIIYLQNQYPDPSILTTNAGLSYYSQNMIASEDRQVQRYVAENVSESDQNILVKIDQLNPSSPTFVSNLDMLIEKLSFLTRIKMFEESIYPIAEEDIDERKEHIAEYIRGKYNYYLTTIQEPVQMLLESTGPQKGKVKVPKIKPSETDAILQKLREETTGDEVYLHTLYSEIIDKAAHGVAARRINPKTRIRIFKPSEFISRDGDIIGGWRDVYVSEIPVYNPIIQSLRYEETKKHDQHLVYGIDSGIDTVFRIVNKLEVPPIKWDAVTGRICTSLNKSTLIRILYHLKRNPTLMPAILPNETREVMLHRLEEDAVDIKIDPLSKFSDEKIEFFYRWFKTELSRESLCKAIRDELERLDEEVGNYIIRS